MNTEIKNEILALLQNCDVKTLCNNYFADDFLWMIKGTSILSGSFTDKQDFLENVIGRLNKVLEPAWKLHVLECYLDGNTMIVEMKGEAKTTNGEDYNNEYCWIFKFNDDMKIAKLTAYYDSLLVNKTLSQA